MAGKKGSKKTAKDGADGTPLSTTAPMGLKDKKLANSRLAAFASLRVEDLDEKVLINKLSELDKELDEYKERCERLKKENDWYRQEIETSQKDTAEYIAYLESKRAEKQTTINNLMNNSQKDFDAFMEKKKAKEQEHIAKINELKTLITEMEMKVETRNQEIMSLSDILSKRARHEVEISKLRKEMHDMEQEHRAQVLEIERGLLESRMKMQKEAEAKIASMETDAHQKAAKYLNDHTDALEEENKRLERELRRCIEVTQDLVQRKLQLEQQNRELQQEQRVRDDIIRLRISKIRRAVDASKRERLRECESLNDARRAALQRAVAKKAALLESALVRAAIEDDVRAGDAQHAGPNALQPGAHAAVWGSGLASAPAELQRLALDDDDDRLDEYLEVPPV